MENHSNTWLMIKISWFTFWAWRKRCIYGINSCSSSNRFRNGTITANLWSGTWWNRFDSLAVVCASGFTHWQESAKKRIVQNVCTAICYQHILPEVFGRFITLKNKRQIKQPVTQNRAMFWCGLSFQAAMVSFDCSRLHWVKTTVSVSKFNVTVTRKLTAIMRFLYSFFFW